MSKEQSQVSIEDEVVAVRVLSVIFVTFMVLIVGSYSDIPREEAVKNTETHSIAHSNTNNTSHLNHRVSIKSGVNTNIRSLIK